MDDSIRASIRAPDSFAATNGGRHLQRQDPDDPPIFAAQFFRRLEDNPAV